MGMAAILFNDAEPFEQIVEDPMWYLLKIDQVVSDKKTFKDYTIFNMYIAKGKGR